MATEQGIVVKVVDSDKALVATTRYGACGSCSARGMCHSLGGGGEKKDAEVEVINTIGAAAGDRILLDFKTGSYLKALFLLYIFPVLCLLAGALIGQEFASTLFMDPSAVSAVFGFSFLGVAILIVKSRGNQMADKEEYRPRIIRVIARGEGLCSEENVTRDEEEKKWGK